MTRPVSAAEWLAGLDMAAVNQHLKEATLEEDETTMEQQAKEWQGLSLETARTDAEVFSRRFPHLHYRILRHPGSHEGFGYLCRTEAVPEPGGWRELPFETSHLAHWQVVEVWQNGSRIG